MGSGEGKMGRKPKGGKTHEDVNVLAKRASRVVFDDALEGGPRVEFAGGRHCGVLGGDGEDGRRRGLMG